MTWRGAEHAFEDPFAGRETLPRTFQTSAQRHADSNAQMYKGGVYDRTLTPTVVPSAPDGEFASLTYSEMRDVVETLAAGFRDLGVAPGDRVAIFAHTRMEWAQSDLAILTAGGVVTTVYPDSSASRVQYLLDDPEATGVIVENADLLDRVRTVEDDLDLSFVVAMDEVDTSAADCYTLEDVHDRGQEAESDVDTWIDERDPDDLASLIYTSGTTGRPKGVQLTHWNFKSNVDQCRARFGPRPDKDGVPTISEDSKIVSFLPLAHVFERLGGHFLMFASGATVAYAENPDTLRDDFAAVSPTTGTSVPRVYEKIYAAIREQAASSSIKERIFHWATDVGRTYATTDDPGSWLRFRMAIADRLVFSTIKDALGGEIDFLISGGGSLSADLCELYQGMGLPILEGYGLTETSPVITANPVEDPRIGTIGPPVLDLAIAVDMGVVPESIFDDATGDVGELLVCGPNVTKGYWNLPDESDAAFVDDLPETATEPVGEPPADAESWFRTGDIVEIGEDGYLRFRERLKELIVLSTGKNVAPGPIEDAFASNDVVEQCMVVGDDREFVAALIVPNQAGIREWAELEGIDLPEDPETLCSDERVHARIAEEVDRVNESFERYEQIKRFVLVPEEFTEENDLLTPTLKKKRREITARFASDLDSIYETT